jgi:hypothetical protein
LSLRWWRWQIEGRGLLIVNLSWSSPILQHWLNKRICTLQQTFRP